MKNIIKYSTLILFFGLFSCVDREFDEPSPEEIAGDCKNLTPTKTVEEIYNLATTTPQLIFSSENDPEEFIEAYVTSSDFGGNFFKSISFVSVDGQLGFSVPVDQISLHANYKPGRKVFVKLNKKYISKDHDGLVIGNQNINPSFPSGLSRLFLSEYQSVLTIGCEKKDENELVITGQTISQAVNNANLNKLIEFDNVQFKDAFVGKTYYDPNNDLGSATNNEIVDVTGGSVIARVSMFSTFSEQIIPEKSGKIRGVLTKFNGTFQFMIREINDVKLTGERIIPIFDEGFSTATFANWSKISVTGAQVWSSANFGSPAPCALMNGFASGSSNVNEDWLISPALNFSTVNQATLSFQTSTRFNGPLLDVLVSTNYDGTSAPSSATWTQLNNVVLPIWTTGSFTPWTSSGGLNLSSYAGNNNVRIAFKYTSTSSQAAAWQVDNVKIVGF
jgi:hypothetical protein